MILLLCSDILLLKSLVKPMCVCLQLSHSVMYITFLELQLKFLFIMKVFLGSLKVYDCPSIILQTLNFLLLHLLTPLMCCSPNLEEVSIFLRFLGYQWLLMILNISLILSLCLNSSNFLLFLWIVSGFLL